MPRAMPFAILLPLLAMTSACGQRERPRTVSDFCQVAQRITAEPAPSIGADDPGNHFDTDDTLMQVLGHNGVFDALCANRAAR